MPPRVAGGATSLPAWGTGPPAAGVCRAAAQSGYGQMVPLRGGPRLIRYLSTAEFTHELFTM